ENFQELKKRILETYQKYYPQFQGDWKNFSSKDIRQLIDLIETELKERVSEKWIYTHLKPESNEKLPRKDMLDIFSRFIHYADWDEFLYKNQIRNKDSETASFEFNSEKRSPKNWLWLLLLAIPILGTGIYFLTKNKTETQVLEIKNEFTKEPVSADEIQVYTLSENEKTTVEIEDSKIELKEKDKKILIESPYFEKKKVEISSTEKEIFLKPEDYAMVLKNFI